mmetsp:Transcript_6567/g.15974  ORF Transcript_6567/g.15974 Transcript_6567/m.15974 type:complete len:470 (-) Transcript_6567:378-1787(-)
MADPPAEVKAASPEAPAPAAATTTTTTTTATATATTNEVAGPESRPTGSAAGTNGAAAAATTADSKEHGSSSREGPQFIIRVSCELGACGNIIGRGGDKIKAMTEASGASISLSDYMKGSTHRTATIRGNRKSVIYATKLVARALNEPKLINNEVPEMGEPLKFVSVVLVIPKIHVGGIIGKGGEKIKALREESECKILISDKATGGPDNTVTVAGPTAKVEHVIERCIEQIAEHVNPNGDYTLPSECIQSSRPHGGGYGGGGYNPRRSFGHDPSGPSMYLNPSLGLSGRMSLQAEFAVDDVGTIIGRGGERVKRIHLETGVSVNISPLEDGQPTRIATLTGPPKGVAAALHFIAVHIGLTRPHRGTGPLTIMIRLDSRELGSIIGKRGSRINQMRDESGARIEIDPQGGISIEGQSPNLAAGLQMVIMLLHEQREKFGTPGSQQKGGPHPQARPQARPPAGQAPTAQY